MIIGIDISQMAYENTGVANYLQYFVQKLISIDTKNQYVLFYSSLRKNIKIQISKIKDTNKKVKIKEFKFPQSLLNLLWNKLHIFPIEWFIGDVDIFISSDWAEPPASKAKKATILYDLIIYKYPEETDAKIVATQKRKLNWAKKECTIIFCISESTKRDAIEILGIEEKRLKVIYPGV